MATNTKVRAKQNEETRDKRPTAIAKYIRIAPSKVAIVLDLVRGKSYAEAAAILSYTNKSASPVILKVLNSAAANAENNLNMSKDTLFVAECYALQGPTMKRMMPRAKGRGDRILKRTSHIRVILDEKIEKPVTQKAEPKKAASKTVSAVKKEVAEKKAAASKPAATKPAAAKKPVAKKETSKEVTDGSKG